MSHLALLAVLLVVPVIAVSGCTSSQPQSPEAAQAPADSGGNVVEIATSGFSPDTLTIKSGETVKFVNAGSGQHWPASDVHPLHTEYPGSGIVKCGSGEQIFDACGGLEPGGEWEFTFHEKGTWKYHDHLNPWMSGKVIVE